MRKPHWTKPDLGLYDFQGSTHNNIIPDAGGSITYNPEAPKDSRYVMLQYVSKPFGYHGYTSPDGLHWTAVSDQPLLPGGDVVNLSYDPVTKQYVATFKDRLFQSDTPGIYDRSAFVSTSKDFIHWTPEVLAMNGDVADNGVAYAQGGLEGQIYGMPTFRYGDQYLAMPWDFSITDYTTGTYAMAGDGPITPGIASSRDLVHWKRPARGPVIQPGNPGAWDDGTLYSGEYLRVTPKTFEVVYGGFAANHGGPPDGSAQHAAIGLATWRRDGFVSLTNAATTQYGDPGSVTTKPLLFTGDRLHLNVDVHRGGSVKVEVLDAKTGAPIPGPSAADAVAVEGDHVDTVVQWKRDASLASVAGRQVKLKISMTGADLYSFWFSG